MRNSLIASVLFLFTSVSALAAEVPDFDASILSCYSLSLDGKKISYFIYQNKARYHFTDTLSIHEVTNTYNIENFGGVNSSFNVIHTFGSDRYYNGLSFFMEYYDHKGSINTISIKADLVSRKDFGGGFMMYTGNPSEVKINNVVIPTTTIKYGIGNGQCNVSPSPKNIKLIEKMM